MSDIPRLYFRRRRQGALVFRLVSETRASRLTLVQIAAVTGKGEIRPNKRTPPKPGEEIEIRAWIAAPPPEGPEAEALRAINILAGWVQRDATDAEINAAADPILLALHDLRQTVVRRLADIGKATAKDDEEG